jgi:hypothetical protein
LSFKRAIVTFLAFDVCGRAAADEPADAPPSQDAQDNRFGKGSADGLAVDFVVESITTGVGMGWVLAVLSVLGMLAMLSVLAVLSDLLPDLRCRQALGHEWTLARSGGAASP